MQVFNKKIFIEDSEQIICSKCGLVLTEYREDAFRSYDHWKSEDGQTSAVAEEYIVCPKCHKTTTLAVWTEEF